LEVIEVDRILRSCAGAGLIALALAPVPAQALPVISEFFYDAVGSDDGLSFVELYGTPGSSLAGFALEGVNGSGGAVGPSLALSGVIPADGIFVVADATSGGQTQVANADLLLDFDFQNGPDSVVLRNGGTVLDALGYGVFAAGDVNAGEGAPAADPAAGASLARRFADVDTGDNTADFVTLDTPTPGSAPVAVPEPASASLLGAGLVGLAAAGGRRRPRMV
jgi:hypothetical protein